MTVAVAVVAVVAVDAVAAAVVVVEVAVPWHHRHRHRHRLLRSLAAEDAAIGAGVAGALLLASYWSYSWAGTSDPGGTRSEP